jgi:hypothetical protein
MRCTFLQPNTHFPHGVKKKKKTLVIPYPEVRKWRYTTLSSLEFPTPLNSPCSVWHWWLKHDQVLGANVETCPEGRASVWLSAFRKFGSARWGVWCGPPTAGEWREHLSTIPLGREPQRGCSAFLSLTFLTHNFRLVKSIYWVRFK